MDYALITEHRCPQHQGRHRRDHECTKHKGLLSPGEICRRGVRHGALLGRGIGERFGHRLHHRALLGRVLDERRIVMNNDRHLHVIEHIAHANDRNRHDEEEDNDRPKHTGELLLVLHDLVLEVGDCSNHFLRYHSSALLRDPALKQASRVVRVVI